MRSLARLYAMLLPGTEDPLISDRTLSAAVRPRTVGRDRVLGLPTAFGRGFALPSRA
ncbi:MULTISPECIES: hypothetical protein [Streptosporangium]|uniref:Uncharacterized protein n=1 Tax=Streptosporangium brasiliense TaxID=47480 RepID=A0ABT9RIA8_9ACTN|nr:hypothetical protein [Streptosporangium brasiliense]MDP9869027.1 hypothetical protein [Streptosporangium brasiliense]